MGAEVVAFTVSIGWLYLFCFCIGLFYAIFTGVFSGLLGGHGGEAGGDHGDAGGHGDIGHHGDVSGEGGDVAHQGAATASAVAHGEVHFSPLSPIVVAMFLVTFGAVGMITSSALGLAAWLSVGISVVCGFAAAGLTFLLVYKVIQATQASSEATVAGLVGETAEVITAIPRDGLGEIAYVARGARYTAPARSETGATIPIFTAVVIRRIAGNTFYVAPKA
jgi:hypothetical protein